MNTRSAFFIVLVVSGCAQNGHHEPITEPAVTSTEHAGEDLLPLRADWLRSDLKCIERFRAAMRAPQLDVEALVKDFGSPGPHDDVDAGWGVRRVKLHLYGGYTTTWIDILAEGRDADGHSRVAALRARQLGPREQWPALSERCAAAWAADAVPIENGFLFERHDDKLAELLRARTADALGGTVSADVPPELARAMTALASPFDRVVLGRQHGDGGGPPPGRAEIEALVNAKRFDLVRVVLRSIDPGARVYAAWALQERSNSPLSAVDAAAIRTILSQSIELQTSEGCEQLWRSPREALEFLVRGG